MIVLIGGEKGGTGKTTLVTNLAAYHAIQGGDVLIVDTDKQGSASAWAASRSVLDGITNIPSVQKFGKSLSSDVRDLRNRYTDILIDAGGRDSIELRAAMTVADKLYIPIQASQFDVWTLADMNELVGQAKSFNERLLAYVVFNRASTNPSVNEAQEARDLLTDFENLSLVDVVIHDRIAFRKAAKAGLSVLELLPQDDKASKEITTLHDNVWTKIPSLV